MVAARKVVDATYLDTELPTSHPPGSEIELGARVVTPTGLARGWFAAVVRVMLLG